MSESRVGKIVGFKDLKAGDLVEDIVGIKLLITENEKDFRIKFITNSFESYTCGGFYSSNTISLPYNCIESGNFYGNNMYLIQKEDKFKIIEENREIDIPEKLNTIHIFEIFENLANVLDIKWYDLKVKDDIATLYIVSDVHWRGGLFEAKKYKNKIIKISFDLETGNLSSEINGIYYGYTQNCAIKLYDAKKRMFSKDYNIDDSYFSNYELRLSLGISTLITEEEYENVMESRYNKIESVKNKIKDMLVK